MSKVRYHWYRSQEGNVRDLILELEALITSGRTTLIGGDMNICALANPKNYVSESLREMEFSQLVPQGAERI